MTEKQKKEVIAYRKMIRQPLHAPPHYSDGDKTYMLTGANYEHQPVMQTESRRFEFANKLLNSIEDQSHIYAWCILPNHWHLLARVDLCIFRKTITKLHNGTSTQWNREDQTPGRKVWHRFADRRIRSDAHYWASVNYIHVNPVRHGYVQQATEWSTNSIHIYLEQKGKEEMVELWRNYPVGDYGKGWDW